MKRKIRILSWTQEGLYASRRRCSLHGRKADLPALFQGWLADPQVQLEYGEALSGLIDLTFSHTGFQKLEACHRAENTRAGRVLAKFPLQATETVQRFIRENHAPQGEACHCLDREAYESQRLG